MSATDRVPDVLVERLALGELPADQAADIRRRLEAEPGGIERLERIASLDATVLAAHPPRRVADAIRERAGARTRERSSRRAAWFAVPALAGAAALAVLVAVGLPGQDATDPGSAGTTDGPIAFGAGGVDRVKGDAILVLHRKAGSGSEVLAEGATARAGDVLQIEANSAGAASGVIVSIDGRGDVSLHFPAGPDAPTALPAGPFALPRAYELDDAPSFERFVFATSDRTLDVRGVVEAARAAGTDRTSPLALPAGIRQVSVTIAKEGPR